MEGIKTNENIDMIGYELIIAFKYVWNSLKSNNKNPF